MRTINSLFLMLENLPVQFVRQSINGGIHVRLFGAGMQVCATYMNGCLGNLPLLLHGQNDLGAANAIEVPFQFLKAGFDITFQGVR